MKKILLFILLCSVSLFAQRVDSIQIAELNKKLEKLSKLIDQKEDSEVLATIMLANKEIVYKNTVLKVERMEVLLSNNLLARTRVIFTNGTICETRVKDALPLFRINNFMQKIKLYDLKFPDTIVCNLTEVLTYIDELNKANYLPKDDLILLTPGDPEKKLLIQTDLNSFIDFRIYSDLLALLNKEGNGLVQTEVSSKITVNPRSLSKNISMFNYVEPWFKLSKFDNKFKQQTVTDTASPYKIDRLKLNQLAYVELGFRLNIMKLNLFQHCFDILNVGADFKYSDVLFEHTNTLKTINTFGLFAEHRGQILKYKNFGFEYGAQAYVQKIQDASIKNYTSFDVYYIFDFSLFYHPSSNPLDMIFLRFKNIQTGRAEDFYSVLQFGYKSRLSFKK